MRNMSEQVEETERDAVLVEDAALIRMMGFPVLEALPSRMVPYERVDPFILVHEGRMRLSDVGKVDTKHPHRGFDNLWYVIEGSASTGHSTGRTERSSARACPRERSSRSGPGEVPGMPRGSGKTRSARATATPSSAACCSGSTWPGRTSRSNPARSCCSRSRSRCDAKATRSFASWSARVLPCSWGPRR